LAEAIAFLNDDTLILGKCDLEVVDLATGRTRVAIPGHRNSVRSLAITHDGNLVAFTDTVKSTLKVWSLATHQEIAIPRDMLADSRFVVWHPDNRTLVVVTDSRPRAIVFIDVVAKVARARLPIEVDALAIAPNGRVFATIQRDGETVLWDFQTNSIISQLSQAKCENAIHRYLTFSADGRILAVSNHSYGTIAVWDVATTKMLFSIKGGGIPDQPIAFSPDSKILAVGNELGDVTFFEVPTGRQRQILQAHFGVPYSASVMSLAFSPNGKLLATSGRDAFVRLWSVPEVLGGSSIKP
jgi:WD40 repeat protein